MQALVCHPLTNVYSHPHTFRSGGGAGEYACGRVKSKAENFNFFFFGLFCFFFSLSFRGIQCDNESCDPGDVLSFPPPDPLFAFFPSNLELGQRCSSISYFPLPFSFFAANTSHFSAFTRRDPCSVVMIASERPCANLLPSLRLVFIRQTHGHSYFLFFFPSPGLIKFVS